MSINQTHGMIGVFAVAAKWRLVVLAGAGLLFASSATATTYTWTNNTAGKYNWSTLANWSSGVIPVSNSATEVLFSMTLGAGVSIETTNDLGTITLNKLSFAGSFTTTSTLKLSGGDLNFVIDGATLPTINLQKGTSPSIGQNVDNHLILNANTTITTVGYEYLNLYGNISGAGKLTVASPSGNSGRIFLLGSNSYTGGTDNYCRYGLVINSDASLGAVPASFTSSNIYMANGSALASAPNTTTTINPNRGIYLAGGTASFGTDGAGQILVYNGVIEGSGNLKVLKSSLTLGGLNTFTGSVSLEQAATLTVNSIKPLGQTSALGAPTTAANGRITFGGAILVYNGVGDSTDRKIALGGDARIRNNGTGTLNFTNTDADAFSGTASYFMLGGSGPGGTIAGPIAAARFGTAGRGLALEAVSTATWVLTGANTYTEMTNLGGGVLQADDGVGLPSLSPLSFNGPYSSTGTGGVLQNNGTAYIFTRGLGTGAGTITWGASPGGFAANGAKFTVNLGGSSGTLTWASTPNFVANAKILVFGSTTADSEIEFQNPINLNNTTRTIQVNDNPDSLTDIAVLSGALTSTTSASGALTKTGNGVLHLDGTNTYTGLTTISAGYIGGKGRLAGNLTIGAGAGLYGVAGKTLHVTGNVTLNATSILAEPDLPEGGGNIVLAYSGTLTGSFGTTNLPSGSKVDYGTRTNSKITLSRPASGTVVFLR